MMSNAKTTHTLEFELLKLLAASEGHGVGSGGLVLQLLDRGVGISQPTVGRILKCLDHRGFTAKLSNKGRVLTQRGREWLAELGRVDSRRRWAEQLMDRVTPSTLSELRDVLVARRALEREISSQAAIYATEQQINEMRAILIAQHADLTNESRGADQALQFHAILAAASSNHFLEIAANLIRSDREPLDAIMYELGSTIGGESYLQHVEILDAIAARDPEGADRAMVRHMDQYIQYVDSLRISDRDVNIIPRGGTGVS